MRGKLTAWREIAFQNLLLQPEVHYHVVLPRCDWFGIHDTSHLQTTPGSLLPQDHCTGTKLEVIRLFKNVIFGFVHCLNSLKPIHFGISIYIHHWFNRMWQKTYFVRLLSIDKKNHALGSCHCNCTLQLYVLAKIKTKCDVFTCSLIGLW
jgi:hypothetical protein